MNRICCIVFPSQKYIKFFPLFSFFLLLLICCSGFKVSKSFYIPSYQEKYVKQNTCQQHYPNHQNACLNVIHSYSSSFLINIRQSHQNRLYRKNNNHNGNIMMNNNKNNFNGKLEVVKQQTQIQRQLKVKTKFKLLSRSAHISLDQSVSASTMLEKEEQRGEEEKKEMRKKLWNFRLSEESLPEVSNDPGPFPLFITWLEEAITSGCLEPNATTLATVNYNTGRVSSRIILLKDVSETNGFIWYTNYNSQKGQDLNGLKNSEKDSTISREILNGKGNKNTMQENKNDEEGNFASLTFWWPELERQVRIEGQVYKLSEEENERNFQSRPRKFQEAVWASSQSLPISDRFSLDAQMNAVQGKYGKDSVIPRPSHWGGYRLNADRIEFWKGRRDSNNRPLPSDRFEYWKIDTDQERDLRKDSNQRQRPNKDNKGKQVPLYSHWRRQRLQP